MGIREVILIGIICSISLTSLVKPRIGLYGYVWYALARPDVLAFVEDKYRFSLLLAICIMVGSLSQLGRLVAVFTNPISRLVVILQIPIGLSVAFSSTRELALDRYSYYIRMILVLLLIPVLLQTEQHLRNLLLITALSLGVVALKFGIYGLIHGGVELASGYGEILGDNNFVALALAMLIPLCWYCQWMTPSHLLRGILLGIACSGIAAVVMTSSRGGSLAMGLGLVLILLRTKRKLASFAFVALALGSAVYLVRDPYQARMSTLQNYESEPSAESRIEHAKTALAIWKDYPLFGVGFGGMSYSVLASSYMGHENVHVVHNSYLQMLVDSGIFAFLIYTWLILHAIFRLNASAMRLAGSGESAAALPLAIATPLAVFALGGSFYSWQRLDLPYLFLMFTACWYNLQPSPSAECFAERKATACEMTTT